MLLMLMIPILLTIVPGMLYQSMRLLARKKSTLTHYVWTYTMMLYIWLVFFCDGNRLYMGCHCQRRMGCHGSAGKHKLGPLSIGGDIHLLHECDHADAVGIFAPLYMEEL